MGRARTRAAEAGHTLLEVIVVITVLMILSGAALSMMRSGTTSAARFRYLFNAQTRLTRVIKEISYGYGGSQGAAGASKVEKLEDGSLRIDDVEYFMEGSTLKRRRAGNESVVLTGVESFEPTVTGQVLSIILAEAPAKAGGQGLRVTQRVFLRGVGP